MNATAIAQVTSTEPTHSELVELARSIARVAEERADETERERRVPVATIDDMRALGLMRVKQPKAWGGNAKSWVEFYELIYEIAKGCGSTGWCYCVLAGHSSTIGDFPMEAQAEVWSADPTVLASSAFAPTLHAKAVEGGYQVSGKAPFSSGCDYGSWAMVGGLVFKDGGAPAPKVFLIPRTEYTIIDDWHTVGLGGTGSKTLEVLGSFVPAHRAIDLSESFNNGVSPFSLQSAMIGSAQGGLDSFIRTIKSKPGKFGGPPPAESELFQSAIGSSVGDLSCAWELLCSAVAESEAYLRASEPIPETQTLRNRSTTALITRLCLSAMERVFELSGGNGVYDNRLSRALRDVRTAANHLVLNSTFASKDAGAIALKRA